MDYPFQGKWHRSKKKSFEEIIFFVHFYLGSPKLLQRHVHFVNDLGFDAFTFQLDDQWSLTQWPMTKDFKIGIKHRYADQIEYLLNQINERKIIFSFSNPSASAIEAMASRHCSDVTALICDSGPSGPGKAVKSAFNLLETQIYKSTFKSLFRLPFFAMQWSYLAHFDLKDQLDSFPEGFKVLSIQGWKDALIPPDHIDDVFQSHKQLDWRKLSLPEAEHLVGLRDYPELYKPMVKKFLIEVATPISRPKSVVNSP